MASSSPGWKEVIKIHVQALIGPNVAGSLTQRILGQLRLARVLIMSFKLPRSSGPQAPPYAGERAWYPQFVHASVGP